MEKTWKISNIHDLDQVSGHVVKLVEDMDTKEAVVLALYGDLGSGKTTFTKQLAIDLGIEDNVSSPTFVIQKRFDIKDGKFNQLIHIDTYRIDLEDELLRLGWNEDIKGNNLIVVEWPENIADILPKNTIHIYFNHVDETTRKIEIRDE